MSIFFIDFENLKNDALKGVDKLSSGDVVYVFYSNHADNLSFEMHQAILNSHAEIHYYKIKRGGKNALDFQLTCQLSFLMSQYADTPFYIISRDSGFSFVKEFWQDSPLTENEIFQIRSIEEAVHQKQTNPVSIPAPSTKQLPLIDSEPITETTQNIINNEVTPTSLSPVERKPSVQKALSTMLKEVCDNTTMQKIAKLLINTETKQEFYRGVISEMGQKQGLPIYRKISKEFNYLKNECDRL